MPEREGLQTDKIKTIVFLSKGKTHSKTAVKSLQVRRERVIRCCEDTLPPLSYLDYPSDEKRFSLRDRDRLGNDPQWVPGSLSRCSWMFPERLRNKSEFVGSEEIRQVLTEHPKYETPSDRILLRVF